uniref:Ionotropic glutamate receptor C-terminal domain-containing protein n=1 Tax=Rhodnius prolixus TaxID=13249 RepID=T1H939_RHOPR
MLRFISCFYFLLIFVCVNSSELFLNSLADITHNTNIKLILLNKELWRPFVYSFHGSNCIQVTDDNSIFANIILKTLHNVHQSPALFTANIQEVQNRCHSHLVLAKKLDKLPSLLVQIPRWAADRILCLIYKTTDNEFHRFLKELLVAHLTVRGCVYCLLPLVFAKSVGTYLSKGHILLSSYLPKYDGIYKFSGREIVVSTTNFSIYTRIWPSNDSSRPAELGGIELNLFQDMTKRMNLTYKLRLSMEGIGVKENGRWKTGILGDIAEQRADVAIRGLWVSMDKVNSGIVMSSSFRAIKLMFLVPRPKRLMGHWYGVFELFQKYLWSVIAITLIVYTLILYATWKLTKSNIRGKDMKSLERAFFQLYGMLVLGSWPKVNPLQTSQRHLFMWWAIFALLISTSFSSSLVSKLTAPTYSRSVNTIEDFLQEGLTWTLRKPFSFYIVFNNNDDTHKRWLSQIEYINCTEEFNQILQKDDKQVILGYEINDSFHLFDDAIQEDLLEKYVTTNERLIEFFIAFALREGSIFNQAINRYIRYFVESGLVQHITDLEIRHKAIFKQSVYKLRKPERIIEQQDFKSLTLEELKGIFTILIIGYSVAFLIVLFERLHKSKVIHTSI